MQRMNVFADEETKTTAAEMASIAQKTPVIAMNSQHALEQGGFSGQAWRRVKEFVHSAAMEAGLPHYEGFYGLDLENGEFLKSDHDL